MFTLKEIIKNKDKRDEFVKEFKDEIYLDKEESKLLYRSHKVNDIENILNVIGKNFNFLIDKNILEERVPSQEELYEMKYLKYLDCPCTNIEKIPQLNNLEELICFDTNIEKIPYLENLKYLNCKLTNIEKIPYLEKLKFLNCSHTNIKKTPQLKNLKKLICFNTNIKEIPYLPNLKEVYPKDIKMRNK